MSICRLCYDLCSVCNLEGRRAPPGMGLILWRPGPNPKSLHDHCQLPADGFSLSDICNSKPWTVLSCDALHHLHVCTHFKNDFSFTNFLILDTTPIGHPEPRTLPSATPYPTTQTAARQGPRPHGPRTPTAMHPVFFLDEIFKIICENVADSSRRGLAALAALAQTCRALEGISLDVLWSQVPFNFITVLKTLPPDSWSCIECPFVRCHFFRAL